MKERIRHAWAGTVLALCAAGWSVPGMAQDDGARQSCQPRTLLGLYVFSATGFTIPAGVALPKAIVELIRFNGDGSLSVPAATRSINGVIAQSRGVGTYTLRADCTGSLNFVGGPTFDIFVSFRGGDLWMIQTDPNNVLQGRVTRISPDSGS